MNKSEQLEDEKFAADFVDVFGGFPKDQAISLLVRRQHEIRKPFAERAIAESQAPQSKCPRCDGVRRVKKPDGLGSMTCPECRLGDGEPSPTEQKPSQRIGHANNCLYSQAYGTKCTCGAAQEVSPHHYMTRARIGRTFERPKIEIPVEEVSPPSLADSIIRSEPHIPDPGGLQCRNCSKAEGDTRELKAALRHAICDHVHTSGGNDYVLCGDCELKWDYRRTTAKLAVKAEAEKLLG